MFTSRHLITCFIVALMCQVLTYSTPTECHKSSRKKNNLRVLYYDHEVELPTRRPLVIAHRGSSGMLPEHTTHAYRQAVLQGADVIECDLSLTRDLHLVCLHQSWMNDVTDVAERFPDRKTTKYVHDQRRNITDFFSVDFTLKELRTLRVKQRFDFRSDAYDFLYGIPTFEEYIQIAKSASRPVGIYPETKEPLWINSLDIIKDADTTMEDLLVQTLNKHGYREKDDPCFLQSFSIKSLQYLKNITRLPLVKLVGSLETITKDNLREWSEFCYGIGPAKSHIFAVHNNKITKSTGLVEAAHSVGLRVHPYTFRNEDRFLAWDYLADPYAEYEQFFNVSIDGAFTDFPASFSRYLDDVYVECDVSVAMTAVHTIAVYLPCVGALLWNLRGG